VKLDVVDYLLAYTRTNPIPMLIFDIDDALRPIDVRRILALLQIGLERDGNDEAESTYLEFCNALTEVPPG
jgi:hypothetical protein